MTEDTNMITRFALAIVIALTATGSALALIPPQEPTSIVNETVIEKNQAFPLVGPLIVEQCANETCEDPQS
jgi:hypothetical protein